MKLKENQIYELNYREIKFKIEIRVRDQKYNFTFYLFYLFEPDLVASDICTVCTLCCSCVGEEFSTVLLIFKNFIKMGTWLHVYYDVFTSFSRQVLKKTYKLTFNGDSAWSNGF